MNKFYILLLSTIFCTQQTQSMEQQLALKTPSSNEDGYQIQYKPLADLPVIKLSTEVNEYSEKLYAKNLNEKDIEKLIKDGAVVNYKSRRSGGYCSIPHYYACDGSEQGVKNMKMLITHGAALRNLEDDPRPALFMSVQNNLTDMIQLLMPYENPIVTIYKTDNTSNIMEKNFREYMINHCIGDQNISSIALSLKLELMTATRGLKEFVYFAQPNQEVLNLLLENGAQYNDEMFTQMMEHAFPFDQYIDFIKQVCTSGASNAKTLERMNRIKTKVNAIVDALEHNGSHQEK
jgi:hypothetical protein